MAPSTFENIGSKLGMGGGFGRGFRVGFGGFRGFGGVFAWVFDDPTGFGMGSVL